MLLTLAVVFLLDGAALASALAVEGVLLAYLVRPSAGDDAASRLSGRRLITAKSWLLLTFAALYSLGTVAWRATDPFGATGAGGDAAYLPFLNGDAVSLLVVASLFFVGRMGERADASPWRGVAAGARLLGHLLLLWASSRSSPARTSFRCLFCLPRALRTRPSARAILLRSQRADHGRIAPALACALASTVVGGVLARRRRGALRGRFVAVGTP